MTTEDLAETLLWFGEFESGGDSVAKQRNLNKAIELITNHETELKKCFIGDVSNLLIAFYKELHPDNYRLNKEYYNQFAKDFCKSNL